jgi:hypothetical protein
MGSFAPIQANLTERVLSDVAENAAGFSYSPNGVRFPFGSSVYAVARKPG